MKANIILFDLDGTLVDTTAETKEILMTISKNLGIEVDPETLRLLWGAPLSEISEVISQQAGRPELARRLVEKIQSSKEREISPELLITISMLKKDHFIGILTSRNAIGFRRVIKDVQFYKYLFDFVQTGDSCQFLKPDPRAFNPIIKWAQERGLGAESITYFGDTVKYDCLPAQSRQINFVGVCSGASRPHEFLEKGVTQIVHNVSGLSEYLKRNYLLPGYKKLNSLEDFQFSRN